MLTFLATHDGIGVRPAEGLLPTERIDALCAAAEASGGSWSPYATPEGPRPYELNVSLFDLLGFERFVCAHTMLFAVAGIPALYLHSLLATPGAHDLVAHTGRARSINRAHLDRSSVEAALSRQAADQVPGTVGGAGGGVPGTARVFDELSRRLRIRRARPEFAPDARQEVIDSHSGVVAVRRGGTLMALHNVTNRVRTVTTDGGRDLLTGEVVSAGFLDLAPHQCRWLV